MVLVVALFGVHALGMYAGLYWIFPWFDIVTHVWGGVVIGFLVQAALVRFGNTSAKSLSSIRMQIFWFVGIVAIAIGWEFYEYVLNNILAHWDFDSIDTLTDCINDLVGAWVAWMWTKVFVLPRY
jgi:hypothetical protein